MKVTELTFKSIKLVIFNLITILEYKKIFQNSIHKKNKKINK